jgi:hypothetical protein
MRSIIDKSNLGKVIARNMSIYDQPELFLDWVNRESTNMEDVLKWATEADIEEAQERYNEYSLAKS